MSPVVGPQAGRAAVGAARTSVIASISLVGLKVGAAAFTGSVSVLSDALHSSLDVAAATTALVAIRKARQPADAEHPFGHGKFESLAGLVVAALVVAAVGLIALAAVGRLLSGRLGVRQPALAAAAVGTAALVTFLVSRLLFQVARATESVALEADAWHLRADMWTSVAVLLGMIAIAVGDWLGAAGVHVVDPLAALVIAAIVLPAAGGIGRRSYHHLVDRSLPPAEIGRIEALLREHYPQLSAYHRLRTRQAGPERYVDLHLEVPGEESVANSHALCDHLERDLRELLPGVQVLIHVEPARARSAEARGGDG